MFSRFTKYMPLDVKQHLINQTIEDLKETCTTICYLDFFLVRVGEFLLSIRFL